VREDDVPNTSHFCNADPKQVVHFEELLMSQVVQQEALNRLLVEKGVFTKGGFLDTIKIVDREMKRERVKGG
jgi:beta-N-acetylglucosaminidase